MTRTRTIGLAAGVVVLGAGLAALPGLRGLGQRSDVPTYEVARESFARRVYAEGYLKAVEATPVNSPIDIRRPVKIAWLAEDGSRVREGDVVVRFDPTEMERELEDGRSDKSTAQNRIQKRRVERDGQFDKLDREIELAGRELDYAREFQSKDAQIFSRVEIIESEIDERLATMKEENAEASREIQAELAQADLQLLSIERKKADLKIDEAEQGLQSLEIRAPHDGILVFKRNWRGEMPGVGETVWGGQELAEIPKLDEMEAEVFVLEADAGGLEAGLAASVVLEARPEIEYRCTVKKVDALAKRKVRWVPIQYFGVTLELEETDPELMKPGQRVRALLTLDERDDVLVVPRESVFELDDKRVVYRQNGSGFEPVEVELGPVALGRVVIEQGLEAGEVIALADPTESGEQAVDAAPPANGPAGPGSL